MIRTNQYAVHWKLDNVARDFDIFRVSKPKELYGSNVLDLQAGPVRALAVQYTFGRSCLALFRKGEMSAARLRRTISEEYDDVTVERLDILDKETCEKNFYYQYRLLALLLMNSMRCSSCLDDAVYNNLSGRLFFSARGWKSLDAVTGKPYAFKFLEMIFDPGMYLNANVKTFRTLPSKEELEKQREDEEWTDDEYEAVLEEAEEVQEGSEGKKKKSSKPRYIVDKKTRALRRVLKTDKAGSRELFTERSFKGKRNTVPFIRFKDLSGFMKSKAGVIHGFLTDVHKELGEYFTLEQLCRENDRTFTGSGMLGGGDAADWAGVLNGQGVNITDECRTESSLDALEILMEELALLGIRAGTGPLKKGAFNIRIIHDAEYYRKNGLPDPYEKDFDGMAVQHATVSMLHTMDRKAGRPACPAVKKLCMELVLKGDVENRKVRVFDWEAFSGGDTWTFVWRDRKKEKKKKGRPKERHYIYYFLRISPDGEMSFSHYDDNDMIEQVEAMHVIAFYAAKEEELRIHHRKYVEGIVYKDPENLHIIARTCMYTMPDIDAIYHALCETGKESSLDIPSVIKALESFQEEYPQYASRAQEVTSQILKGGAPLKRPDLREKLGMRSKAGKAMNRFLHERYGIWVSPEFKDRDFDEEYLISSMTDIGYFYEDDTSGEKGLRTFNYYAGIKRSGLNQSLHTPCIVREVRAQKDIEFEPLLPLLAVDFVRIAKYTVLPFPFKYLREYAGKHSGKDTTK